MHFRKTSAPRKYSTYRRKIHPRNGRSGASAGIIIAINLAKSTASRLIFGF
ncbi:conserved hypothetical protein [Culex quinquefasciatus]|uniref:Uncharacterized protein n=1 Tax=Culex quinquefasciatus TaxID=7176 RepID=B0WLX9_CULQU|nr:conserved hypothetical protein [Culex quinquefasciatus]|eukprot:XP_001849713.1 conserved hypothetical protein [Culex quinquefasciatus]